MLAEQIRDYVRKNISDPDVMDDRLTLDALAKELDEAKVVISFVLDSFEVQPDGTVHYIGTGRGGGWVPVKEETPEEQLKRQLELNVISQEDYDLRMELIKRGEDPRDAAAMQVLLAERAEQAKIDDNEIEARRTR